MQFSVQILFILCHVFVLQMVISYISQHAFQLSKKKKKKVRTCSSQLLIGGDKRGFLVKKTVVCRSAMINRLVIDRKLVTTVFCISQLMVLVFPASETQGFNAFLCRI